MSDFRVRRRFDAAHNMINTFATCRPKPPRGGTCSA